MARYQLRRPSPIQVSATRLKRQEAGLGAVGPGSEADSPGSSPTTGAPSPGNSPDSEDDEPPSPKKSNSPATSSPASTSTSNLASTSSLRATPTTSSQGFVTSSQTSAGTSDSNSLPAITQPFTSQATAMSTTIITSTRSTASPTPTSSPTSQIFSSKIARPATTISILPPGFTGPAEENEPPRRTRPEPTIMSKGAEAAAVTLSIMGAIALVVGILFYCKRRRRRRNEKLEAELERDAANYAALRAPEAAHINDSVAPSDRSTLFGPGSYSRPETVSTRNGSRISKGQPTPNPFADPPLNKAYDVLAGRPRSTTLTDRGSWVKNPFKDPLSERFDPFGELQAKARRERVKQVERARREAELERQFEAKERMGLAPERAVGREGSGVTLEGLGVLDRSAGGAYR